MGCAWTKVFCEAYGQNRHLFQTKIQCFIFNGKGPVCVDHRLCLATVDCTSAHRLSYGMVPIEVKWPA